MKTQAQSAANYSLLAGSYAFWEYLLFGPQLQRCRLAHVDELKDCRHILLLGDGDGRFSTHLLTSFPDLYLTSLDASRAFLQKAKQRREKFGVPENRIQNLHLNVNEWPGDYSRYDACVAQFFFDSFDQPHLPSIIEKISRSLGKAGKVLVSDFHIPTDTTWGNFRGRATIRLLYAVFLLLTGLKTRQLPDWSTELAARAYALEKTTYNSQKTLISQVFRKGP